MDDGENVNGVLQDDSGDVWMILRQRWDGGVIDDFKTHRTTTGLARSKEIRDTVCTLIVSIFSYHNVVELECQYFDVSHMRKYSYFTYVDTYFTFPDTIF